MHARVEESIPPGARYAVVIGERNPLSEARELRNKALATGLLQDAYLSRVELREPAPHAG